MSAVEEYTAAVANADRQLEDVIDQTQRDRDAAEAAHQAAVDASVSKLAEAISDADRRREKAHAQRQQAVLEALDALDTQLKTAVGADPRARLRHRSGGVEVIVDEVGPALASMWARGTDEWVLVRSDRDMVIGSFAATRLMLWQAAARDPGDPAPGRT